MSKPEKQPLNAKALKFLRGQAHSLKPVVNIGKGGVTTAIIQEIEKTAESVELLKIKILPSALGTIDGTVDTLTQQLQGLIIGRIGRVVIYFLPGKENSRYTFQDG